MGFTEIGCCYKCEIPVRTVDDEGFRHVCNRCNTIQIEDDLLFIDFQVAMLNVKAIEEFDKSNKLMDATLDLINDIKKLGETTK